MKRIPLTPTFHQNRRPSESVSLRKTVLAIRFIVAIRTSTSRADMPIDCYYTAPGNYAATQGTVNIPAIGYYYSVPLYAVAAQASPAPAQRITYSNSSSYYPRGSASMEGRVGANVLSSERTTGPAYVSTF
jgi:hypothetical protein